MAFPVNKITYDLTGTPTDLTFFNLKGQIHLPQQNVIVREREGIDGHWFSLTGTRAKPSTLESMQPFNTFADAHSSANWAKYYDRIGDELIKITKAGIDYDSIHSVKFQVIDVQLAEPTQNVLAISPIGGDALGILRATWTVLAVPNP